MILWTLDWWDSVEDDKLLMLSLLLMIEESVDVREAFINPLNPALFGPYNTRGGADLPPSFFLFPELLDVMCVLKLIMTTRLSKDE